MTEDNEIGKLGIASQVVGSNFTPGTITNMMIAEALGRTAVSLDEGESAHAIAGTQIMAPVEDYSNNMTACLVELRRLGATWRICPTVNLEKRKRFTRRFVGMFEVAGEVFFTAPMKNRAHVIACMLLYAAQAKSRVT